VRPPKVSVLIPTWNGEADLARLLPVLAAQDLEEGFEIRAIDSDSSDRTREMLAGANVACERIDKREFGHGKTRNALARAAHGEILVFLSQDALPRDERFLTQLTGPFADPKVAGVTARILPHADDDPLTARTVLAALEASAEPDARVGFNDVASAVRRSVHEAIPFPDVEFGEDSAWAARALAAGWKIKFEPSAVVFHAHRYGPRAAFARYKIDARFQREVHGRRVRPTLVSLLRGIAYEVWSDARFVVRERASLLHLVRSPFLRTAQVLGQYLGSRGPMGEARGRAG
jgi:rhamnosyltransferase